MIPMLAALPQLAGGLMGAMGGAGAASTAGGGLMGAIPGLGSGAAGPAGQYAATGFPGPGAGAPEAASVADTLNPPGMGDAMPKPPSSFTPGDVSGFANYGMQAPQLDNQVAQLKGLMSFMDDPHRASKEDPFLPARPRGGLMNYLDSLGV